MSETTVLIVDDEADVAELYADFLGDTYATRVADSGEAALEAIDDAVDVVLLDRRMPEMSGDETLDALRSQGYDCPVVMVSAVDPDIDIVDMRCNEYLVKSVGYDELHETVERMLALSEEDVQVKEYFALVAKQATLETELEAPALENDAEYQELLDRIEALRERAEPAISNFQQTVAGDASES
jgi:DNA-binding NtrC family response regulator